MSEVGDIENEEVVNNLSSNPEVVETGKAEAIKEGRLERLAVLSKVTNWVETKFNEVVPEDKREKVKTVLGLIPFFNATCDTLKGEALQQEALLRGVKAVKEKDWNSLKTEFGNWFKGAVKETVGKLEILADIATSGEASPAKTTIIEGAKDINKGIEGERVIRNSGGFIQKLSESIVEKHPQVANVLNNVGSWLTNSTEKHPDAVKIMGGWINQQTEPIRNALSNFDKPVPNPTTA